MCSYAGDIIKKTTRLKTKMRGMRLVVVRHSYRMLIRTYVVVVVIITVAFHGISPRSRNNSSGTDIEIRASWCQTDTLGTARNGAVVLAQVARRAVLDL